MSLCGVEGLLLARTYAISKNDRAVLIVLGCLMLGSIIPQIIFIAKDSCTLSNSDENLFKLLATIGNTFNLLFETAVFTVTLIHTLGVLRLQRGLQMMQKKSLVQLLTEQGILRYGFVLTFSLASTVYSKIGEMNIRGALSSIQQSLSIVIICRLFLDLRLRNLNLNDTTLPSLPSPIGNFQAATQHVHNAILEEFSNPISDVSSWEESIHEGIKLKEDQQQCSHLAVSLTEHPWALGEAGQVE